MVDHFTEASPPRLQQLLTAGRMRLGNDAAARLDAEVLLAHVLRRSRSALIAEAERPVSAPEAERFHALIARRHAGEPVAYLTGEREFWSLPLSVDPAVLIPRAETELVVERALALLPAPPARTALVRALDLGTGSGAIALALASERPHWRLTASDRSAAALQVARSNAQRLGLQRVEFVLGDWFAPLAGKRFELICSNPPYVAAGDSALAALRFEPRSALTPGATGLEALRHLIAQAPDHLEHGGWLVLEHGSEQAHAVAAALVATGYALVRCHRDLAGHDRITEAQWGTCVHGSI
jgi:release factor glutamine methyltransferase